jgi:hypothetical protein
MRSDTFGKSWQYCRFKTGFLFQLREPEGAKNSVERSSSFLHLQVHFCSLLFVSLSAPLFVSSHVVAVVQKVSLFADHHRVSSSSLHDHGLMMTLSSASVCASVCDDAHSSANISIENDPQEQLTRW